MRTPRRERLRNNDVVGKIVVLARDAKTKSGVRFPQFTRMRVSSTWAGKFDLVQITKTGRDARRNGCLLMIRGLRWGDFMPEDDGTIPTS